jgi:hypothetical protein
LHLTPTSSSWLNLVERFFGEITRKVIRSGSFLSVGALVADIFPLEGQPAPYSALKSELAIRPIWHHNPAPRRSSYLSGLSGLLLMGLPQAEA